MIINTSLFGQNKKENSDIKKITFGLGYNISLESLDDNFAEFYGVSSVGYTWIDMCGKMNFLKYFNIDLGFSISHFKDELPFSQAVVFTSGTFSGLSSNEESKIVSGSIYYSLGFRVPLISKINLIGSYGRRGFSASRTISFCDDCKKTKLNITAGNYLKTGLSWLTLKNNGIPISQFNLLYTHYFDSSFQYTHYLGILDIFWLKTIFMFILD